MVFYVNASNYPLLLPTAAGNNVAVKPGFGVEGAYFAKFSHLVAIDFLPEEKVVWSQSKWEAKGKAYLSAVRPSPASPKVEPSKVAVPKPVEPVPVVDESEEVDPPNVDELSRPQLVSMATKLGVPDAKSMKKSELVEAIKAVQGV